MTADNRKFSQEFGQESTAGCLNAIDFDFLATQTFADPTLEREVLELFLKQSRRLASILAHLDPADQSDAAHLLKGSARGIGAWSVAEAAEAYESASADKRHLRLGGLIACIDDAARAIAAHLGL